MGGRVSGHAIGIVRLSTRLVDRWASFFAVFPSGWLLVVLPTGGYNAISAYKIGEAVPADDDATPAPVDNPTPSEVSYDEVGCFQDNKGSPKVRIMGSNTESDNMTPEVRGVCVVFSLSFLRRVEGSIVVFGGPGCVSGIPQSLLPTLALNAALSPAWLFLLLMRWARACDLLAQLCADRCNDGSNTHFGNQYGRECWCADDSDETSIRQHGTSTNCKYECSGDADEDCGGWNAMSVYKYT